MTGPFEKLTLRPPFRLGRPEDAPILAEFIAGASGGLAPIAWTRAAGGKDARALGTRRMAARAAAGEWLVADPGDGPVAGLMGHPLPPEPAPIPEDMEPLFVPLQELENLAPATWYVHVLATREGHRRAGWGSCLLALAEETAEAEGITGVSIIVADDNLPARRLYESQGYRELARRDAETRGWETRTREWVLLVKGAGTLLDPEEAEGDRAP